MRDLIVACMQGELTFADFTAGTIKYWQAAAADLLRRWDHPAAIEADDLVQEMLLVAWQSIETADPARGDVRRYVVFGATKAARRWLHRQRGAYGFARTSGKNRSPEGRYPVGVDWIDDVGQDEPDTGLAPQEQAVAILESMQLAQTEHDRQVLEAFWAEPCVESVARKLCRSTRGRGKRAEQREKRAAKVAVLETIGQITQRAANC